MYEYSNYKIPIYNLENSKTKYKFQDIILIKSKKSQFLLEVSPLKGFNNESVKQIEEILISKKTFDISKYPSFEYALSNYQKTDKNNISVKSSILIANNEDIMKNISNFCNLGFNTFKIKVSKNDYLKKIELLKSINSSINIRIDFNNEFSTEDSINILNNINYNFEFIEGILNIESIKNYRLLKDSKHNLCLDINSKNLLDIDKIIKEKLLSFIAIKPKILGDERNTQMLAKECQKNNIKSYISSTFETQIGFNKSIFLAKYLDDLYNEEIIHGFGTYNFLEKSLLEGISLNKGYIESEFSEIDIKNLSTYQTTKWKKIVNLEIIEKLKNA
ncbi:MAG: hypothetical protein CL772_05560 [Chloroflexi bacterium]|nr:hypothetical protein [Chloroflexota bacterium]|tara:strand:- start:5785 stop:6780 length:996 start_codon:yes stop_codon:yes gene_type:complete